MERRAIVGWVDAETRRRGILVWPGCADGCGCGSYQPEKKKTREKENPEAGKVGVCEGEICEEGVLEGGRLWKRPAESGEDRAWQTGAYTGRAVGYDVGSVEEVADVHKKGETLAEFQPGRQIGNEQVVGFFMDGGRATSSDGAQSRRGCYAKAKVPGFVEKCGGSVELMGWD